MKNKNQTSPQDFMPEEFFHGELKDISWAEKHLLTDLPKIKKTATSTELQKAFGDHLETTRGHVERPGKAFGLLGYKAMAKRCEAMKGIFKEGAGIIEDTEAGTATRGDGVEDQFEILGFSWL